ARLGVKANGEAIGQVVKTWHTAHGGKLSVTRLLAGSIAEGAGVTAANSETARVAGVFRQMGANSEKRGAAAAGETVGLGKLDAVATGDTVTTGREPVEPLVTIAPLAPVMALAVAARERKNDVKLGQALH